MSAHQAVQKFALHSALANLQVLRVCPAAKNDPLKIVFERIARKAIFNLNGLSSAW